MSPIKTILFYALPYCVRKLLFFAQSSTMNIEYRQNYFLKIIKLPGEQPQPRQHCQVHERGEHPAR